MANKKNTSTVLESLLGNGVVATNVKLTKVLGSLAASTILSQFLFYSNKAKYIDRKPMTDSDGVERIFFMKTAKEIYEETGVSEDVFTGARKTLRSCGVLVEVLSKGIYYAVNVERLIEIIREYDKQGAKIVKKQGYKLRAFQPKKCGKFQAASSQITEDEIAENTVSTFRNFGYQRSENSGINVPKITERTPMYIIETKERVIESINSEEFSLTQSLENEEKIQIENVLSKSDISLPLEAKKEEEKPPYCAAAPEPEQQERPMPESWLELVRLAGDRKPKMGYGGARRTNEIELPSEIIASAWAAGKDSAFCDHVRRSNGMKPNDPLFGHFTDFIENAIAIGHGYQNEREFRQHIRNFVPQNIRRRNKKESENQLATGSDIMADFRKLKAIRYNYKVAS
jgi:hypothetical protein